MQRNSKFKAILNDIIFYCLLIIIPIAILLVWKPMSRFYFRTLGINSCQCKHDEHKGL